MKFRRKQPLPQPTHRAVEYSKTLLPYIKWEKRKHYFQVVEQCIRLAFAAGVDTDAYMDGWKAGWAASQSTEETTEVA